MFLGFALCPIVESSCIYTREKIQKLSPFFWWKKTNFSIKNHFKDIGFGCFLRHPPRSTNDKSLMYQRIGMKCLGTFIFCDSSLDQLANEHIIASGGMEVLFYKAGCWDRHHFSPQMQACF